MNKEGFLSERRLQFGPWQAFERDVARLMIANGFDEVRLVGGSGDLGADVIGVLDGKLWVFQCKHTTASPPPKTAIKEVVNAAQFYKADRVIVAISQPPSQGFLDEVALYKRRGQIIEIATPKKLFSMMEKTPEYPKSRRSLRPYQEDAAQRFREALLDTGRGQVIMATGLGKTIVMSELVADLLRDERIRDGKILIMAHTRELVTQLHRAFWHQIPNWVSTHQLSDGEFPSYWDGITFATVQSVLSRIEDLPAFGLVLVDEAHHIGADIFRRSIAAMSPPMLGGVTATPWRGDDFEIDELLGPPLVRIGIADGLKAGFLSEVDYRLMADDLDWDFVQQASRHKYSVSQLNRRLMIPTRDEQAALVIKETFENENRRGGILFSPTVVHAAGMAAMLRRFGFRTEAITGDLLPRERDALLTKFRSGQLDILTSVDLFNEGVDVPDVDLIVFMRVTHSRRIFVQQLGRGLRVSPDKKNVIVLDFVSDLRRIAEVLQLEKSAHGPVERLKLGNRLVRFRNASIGNFFAEWIRDQASLMLREGDSELELPRFNFPEVPGPGSVQ